MRSFVRYFPCARVTSFPLDAVLRNGPTGGGSLHRRSASEDAADRLGSKQTRSSYRHDPPPLPHPPLLVAPFSLLPLLNGASVWA